MQMDAATLNKVARIIMEATKDQIMSAWEALSDEERDEYLAADRDKELA